MIPALRTITGGKNFGKRQKFALLTIGLPTVAHGSDLLVFVERVPKAIKCDTGNK